LSSNPLFNREGELRKFFENIKLDLKREVEGFEDNYLLNVSELKLQQYLISEYSLESPEIIEDEIYVIGTKDVDITLGRDITRGFFDQDSEKKIKGSQITIGIPFRGDAILFDYRPSTFNYNPPRAEVHDTELHLIYKGIDFDSENLKSIYNRDVGGIKKYLDWIKKDVDSFNQSLPFFCKQIIETRKRKLNNIQKAVENLGLPIKRTKGASQTYAVPSIVRKTKINKPVVNKGEAKREPILPSEEYENILTIVQNMVLVIERSPKAFSDMSEENLRQHFLVQLNGQYEGQAIGETFNFGGKTDILIRYEGKNVFIAECKFWKGEKDLLKTVDQLLSYTSWRDTKTAILLFNKNKDFSSVLDKITPTISSHVCYIGGNTLKERKLKEGTIFSFVFHQPNDNNKKLLLTVMAFNIPN